MSLRKIAITVNLLMLLLVAGCSDRHADSRLLEVDSLLSIQHNEQARTLLQRLTIDSVEGRGNKALYALLATKADYKCYVPATTDSLINRAVDYYSESSDKDRYIDALIYQGAALGELGRTTEALSSLKKAESLIDSTDYENLGYVNLRMGNLYTDVHILNNENLEKLKKALYYYDKTDSKRYQMFCASAVGALYRKTDIDSAIYYLNRAISLAKELADSVEYFYNIGMLSRAYSVNKDYVKQKDIAVYAVKYGAKYLTDDNPYYDASEAYAKLGNADSARYYYDICKKVIQRPVDEIVRLSTILEIHKLEGDYKSAYYENVEMNRIEDSLYVTSMQQKLLEVEKKYDKQLVESENEKLERDMILTLLILACCLIVIILVCIIIYKRRVEIREKVALIMQLQEENKSSADRFTLQLKAESRFKEMLEKQLNNIREIISMSHQYASTPELFVKKFKEKVQGSKLPTDFWKDIRYYVDSRYDNIITDLEEEYPDFADDELMIICLMCCGFSYIEISICMGYANCNYVNNKKSRIAKKMGLTESLKDYIDRRIQSTRK